MTSTATPTRLPWARPEIKEVALGCEINSYESAGDAPRAPAPAPTR